MSETSTGRLVAAEFVGTLIVMLGGPGILILGGPEIGPLGLAIGLGAATAIAIGVIGAVANPMFSLALWFSKGITTREAVSDLVGQLLGGIAGAALIFGLNDSTRLTSGINGWDPDRLEPGVDLGINLSGFSDMGVVLSAELLLGTLVVVVLLSAIKQQRSNAAVAAFTGAAVTVAALILHRISGTGINPARSLGTAIFADVDPNALGQVWAFILIPIVAALAGTFVWLAIDDATIDDTVFNDTILEDLTDRVTGDES